MDPKKRLQLNFGGLGGGGYSNDRNYTPTNERVFPTTPSTFPQTVFPASNLANEYASAQVQTNYSGQNAGYFPTGAYQTQYSQPQPQSPYQQSQFQGQQYQYQAPQQNLAAPQASYQQQLPRQTGYNSQDPNSGLARQFSNQNLGTPQRLPSPYGRQPSPSNRQYTNGQQPSTQQNRNQANYTSNQQPQSNLLTPSTNGQSLSASAEEPPEKNVNKYSSNVQKRGQGLHALVEAYFKENITRARDRNVR